MLRRIISVGAAGVGFGLGYEAMYDLGQDTWTLYKARTSGIVDSAGMQALRKDPVIMQWWRDMEVDSDVATCSSTKDGPCAMNMNQVDGDHKVHKPPPGRPYSCLSTWKHPCEWLESHGTGKTFGVLDKLDDKTGIDMDDLPQKPQTPLYLIVLVVSIPFLVGFDNGLRHAMTEADAEAEAEAKDCLPLSSKVYMWQACRNDPALHRFLVAHKRGEVQQLSDMYRVRDMPCSIP